MGVRRSYSRERARDRGRAVRQEPRSPVHASASVARSAGATTPIAATIPSSRRMGTAMVTVPENDSPSLRATPVGQHGREVAPKRLVRRGVGRLGERPRPGSRPGRRPAGPWPARRRRSGVAVPGLEVDPQRRGGDWTSCRQTAVEPDPPGDDGGLARLRRRASAGPGRRARISSSLLTIGAADQVAAAGRVDSRPPCRSTNPNSVSVRR